MSLITKRYLMRLTDRPIPKALEPCPIKSVLIELRYDKPLLDSNLAIGLLFGKLKENNIFFGQYQALAASTLPLEIRESDPNLQFAPLYQIVNEDYAIRVAKHAVCISTVSAYKGWHDFFNIAEQVFSQMFTLGLFNNLNRIGIRYVSFFEENILDSLKLEFNLIGSDQRQKPAQIWTECDIDGLTCALTLSNRAELRESANVLQGSSIDIDVFKVAKIDSIHDCLKLIDHAHTVEKRIFFSLVTDAFLEKYKVVHDE